MSNGEQIKFSFKNDPKFSTEKVINKIKEGKLEQKKDMKEIVREFWDLSVDRQLKIFKKVFQYQPGLKPEEIKTKQVVLGMLNKYSGEAYTLEDYDAVPREDIYNLELSVSYHFDKLKEEKEQGTASFLQEEETDTRKEELKKKSQKHFPSGKSSAEWKLGKDD